MKHFKIITLLLFLIPAHAYSQYKKSKDPQPLPGFQPEYLPLGLDLHSPGNDPFNDRPWDLVFFDDFTNAGNKPKQSDWVISDNQSGVDWTPSIGKTDANNVWIGNGALVLRANYVNGEYKAAALCTRTWQTDPVAAPTWRDWETGRFEARIKFQNAIWSHGTFWTWGTEHLPSEIDIVEYLPYQGRKKMPTHFHNYIKCENDNGNGTIDADNISNRGTKLSDDWHIYTCIWDKYFLYIYFDHQFVYKLPKLFRQDVSYQWEPMNAFVTNAGSVNNLYRLTDVFPKIGKKQYIILSLDIDAKKNDKGKYDNFNNWWKGQFYKQSAGLPTHMFVDWVKVYQRSRCDEDETVTNSALFPYTDLKGRHLTLGTGESSRNWTNIVKRWAAPAEYVGASITLQPNFICEPGWVDATPCTPNDELFDESNYQTWIQNPNNYIYDNAYRPSSALFIAETCPSNEQMSEITVEEPGSDPDISAWDTTVVADTFDCSDIDTVWVDSMITASLLAGDTLFADSILSYLVDTLGCPYWGDGGGGQGKPGRSGYEHNTVAQYQKTEGRSVTIASGRISIYPNPNSGSFTILMPQAGNYEVRVTNIVGAEVYHSGYKDAAKMTVQLDENLPPGNYILQVQGQGTRHIEKITLEK